MYNCTTIKLFMNLKNKVVVITGSSRGLGKELAQIFVDEGAQIVISSRSIAELKPVAEKIDATPIVADVTDEQAVKKLIQKTAEKFGRVDIFINNAGIWTPHAPFEKQDSARFHQMIEVNLFGIFYGSRAALKQMKKQKSGTIINIISTSALEGRKNSSIYCASKYAANGLTLSLQKEVEGTATQVIAVYPGGMKTHLFDEKKHKDYKKFMDPAEVAKKIINNLKKKTPKEKLIIRRRKH